MSPARRITLRTRASTRSKHDVNFTTMRATSVIYGTVLRRTRPDRTTTIVIPTTEIQFSMLCSDLRFRLGAVGGRPYASPEKRRLDYGSHNIK
jgi:hypothetical protein